MNDTEIMIEVRRINSAINAIVAALDEEIRKPTMGERSYIEWASNQNYKMKQLAHERLVVIGAK